MRNIYMVSQSVLHKRVSVKNRIILSNIVCNYIQLQVTVSNVLRVHLLSAFANHKTKILRLLSVNLLSILKLSCNNI